MSYAEVSVNSPVAFRRSFCYGIPAGLNLRPGQAVWVPFGDKVLQGIVLELTSDPSVPETRDILGLISSAPLLSSARLSLARWISSYYLAPLFSSLALMLPPGFSRRVFTFISRNPDSSNLSLPLDLESRAVLDFLPLNDRVSQQEIEKKFGPRRARKALAVLLSRQLVSRVYELQKSAVRPLMVPHLRFKVTPDEARSFLETLPSRAARQADLLRFLLECPHPVPRTLALQKSASSSSSLRALINKGLIEVINVRLDRDPLPPRSLNLSFPPSLTSTQVSVLRPVYAALRRNSPSGSRVFLLHGVTGSGKTEIYLRALEETVRQGKKGIVLVPEIALTPQMIERFLSRFPGQVAVLHSRLTPGEKFDEWWRVRNGEFQVVIGPRSAVFAPQPDLGLIIIDEEHEWAYKQEESPRYHAREVALKLADLTGAVVVLGSATPDVQSYSRARSGEFHLLELPERVTPDRGSPLPEIEVVDLRDELKAGNLSLFSRSLSQAVESALKNQEQVILFLNRRGTSSFVECRSCGLVIRCRRCDIPLSYHFSPPALVCHQCNYRVKVPRACPHCRSLRIKFLGVGTEKVEMEAARCFPQARILRWDSDAVRERRLDHRDIFTAFRAAKADILIGTQMVARGLDFPGVTVVGVISADIALNLPDFRAGERTFQLLCQVAGRSGRGPRGGKVIIQTYSPGHYAVQAAARHDYLSFFQQEMAFRRNLLYPPFSRLARLVFSHTSDLRCRQEVERMKRLLLLEQDAAGLSDISLIGPAPAFIYRLRGKHRWQIILRASDPSAFLDKITFPDGWSLDIDPLGLA